MVQISIQEIIKNQINYIKPFDKLEKEHKEDTLKWIDSGINIFRIQKPDIPLKHLVSYFVLIDEKSMSILLVDHLKALLWLPTGGHVELDEDPKDTVKREILEELGKEPVFLNNGLPFFITQNTTVGLTPGHIDVDLWYLMKGDSSEILNFDKGEFKNIKWFSIEEVLKENISHLDPHMHRFAKKLIDYQFISTKLN